MPKYLFVYHGGRPPSSPEELKERIEAWGKWMGSLGTALLDGGAPTTSEATVSSDGSLVTDAGPNPVTGYSLVEAADLNDAHAKAKGCPQLGSGGNIELSELADL